MRQPHPLRSGVGLAARALVFLHYECDGYRRDSFWRASSAVNLHSTLAPLSLRERSQAPLCPASVSLSGMRLERHCRESTENSISTWFSHEPCLGVWWNSSFSTMRRASPGSNAL